MRFPYDGTFMPRFPTAGAIAFALLFAATSTCWAFRFSDQEGKADAEADAKAERVRQLVSVSCQQKLRNRKIMTLIAEYASNGWVTNQFRYGPHFNAINQRLRALGLRTYTQEEIRAQIAQAEIDAYFRNDPDAALSASRRLGASYILRGTIRTQAAINPVLRIREVAVNMGFTLSSSNGHTLSDVAARSESYSGTDTLGMALTLVNEQADEIVAQLYNDYCRKAGTQN